MSNKIKITRVRAYEIAKEWGEKIYDIQTASRKKESEDIARIYEGQGIDHDFAPPVPDVESSKEELVEDFFWSLAEESDIYEVEKPDDDD